MQEELNVKLSQLKFIILECIIQAYNAIDTTTKTCGIHSDDSPLTESWADVDAVPALKVTVQLSLIPNSLSRSR